MKSHLANKYASMSQLSNHFIAFYRPIHLIFTVSCPSYHNWCYWYSYQVAFVRLGDLIIGYEWPFETLREAKFLMYVLSLNT